MNKTLTALVLAAGITVTGCNSCSKQDTIIGYNTGIIATPIRIFDDNSNRDYETSGMMRFACDTKTGRDFVTVEGINYNFKDEAVDRIHLGDSIAYPIYRLVNEHSITTKYNDIKVLKHAEKK